MVLHCGNHSCMAIVKNLVFHAYMKHIEIQYYYVRELIVSEEIEMVYYSTIENCADIFTKALCRDTLEWLLPRLGIGPRH